MITDKNPYRLDLARKMGVTLAVDTAEKPLQTISKALSQAEACSGVFDATVPLDGSRSLVMNPIRYCLAGLVSQAPAYPGGQPISHTSQRQQQERASQHRPK